MFVIIPRDAVFSKNLSANAKLLYGEIIYLSHKTTYCRAKNEHFAKAFDTSTTNIAKWIMALRNAGYINVFYEYFPNSKKVKERHITPVYSDNKPEVF